MRQERQKLGLKAWFVRATLSGRTYLTVPPHIAELPCGHVLTNNSPPFTLRKTAKGWMHQSPDCREVLELPETQPLSSAVEKRLHLQTRQRSRFFVR